MPKANTICVPLSILDRNAVATRINMGYVVQAIDIEALRNATERVVEQWRLLAGRVEWSPAERNWCLSVPLGDIEGAKFKFSQTTSNAHSSNPLLHLNKTSTEVLVRPALKLFCDPSSTSHSLSSYASAKSPLLAIHVNQLADCVCVGISVPHGIFDASGLGQVIHAIDAELNGKAWTPPPLSSTNPMQETLQKLITAPTVDSRDWEPPALERAWQAVVPMSLWSVVSFLVSYVYEFLWQRANVTRAVYLGEDMVKSIVEPVKASLRADGAWVSTADILVAWFIKAAYLDEQSSKKPVTVTSVVSVRKTLEAEDKRLSDYPHNTFMYSVFPLQIDTIALNPIATLASTHRTAVEDSRTLGYVQSYHKWMNPYEKGVMPIFKRGIDAWVVTNQIVGRLDDICFGSPTYAVWNWVSPIDMDHLVTLNKFNGGYMLQARIRKTRWDAVESEVDRLKGGARSVF